MTKSFGPSARTRALDFQYEDARLDRRAYRWWIAVTIVWFLVVPCGGVTTGVWLGVATGDPGGVDYGVGVLCIIVGALILGAVGTVLGTSICFGYWRRDGDDEYTSPGRLVARLRYRLDESRQRDADEFMRNV